MSLVDVGLTSQKELLVTLSYRKVQMFLQVHHVEVVVKEEQPSLE
jgi:hypothetical protein